MFYYNQIVLIKLSIKQLDLYLSVASWMCVFTSICSVSFYSRPIPGKIIHITDCI